jgi:hypothetical protein
LRAQSTAILFHSSISAQETGFSHIYFPCFRGDEWLGGAPVGLLGETLLDLGGDASGSSELLSAKEGLEDDIGTGARTWAGAVRMGIGE